MTKRVFAPGPVPVPPDVMEACARPVLHHRSSEFKELSQHIWKNLQTVFCTINPVLVLAGSGMSGIEACIASTVAPGDKVFVIRHGRFGERLAEINRRYGATVIELSVEWGETVSIELIENCLREEANISTVWLVHSETSTGVALDLESVSAVVHRYAPDALLMVDAVLSIAIQEVQTDRWKLDAVVTGIQKGLMCPPGLACLSISDRFIDRLKYRESRSYTLDLKVVLKDHQYGLFTWTPPVSLIAGLHVALTNICRRGLPEVWAHHTELSDSVRQNVELRGMALFGTSNANGVVVLEHPQSSDIIRQLDRVHNMIVIGGQDQLDNRVIRIGTCGSYTIEMMNELFDAIDNVLSLPMKPLP